MMRTCSIIIFLIVFALAGNAQNYETYKGDTINYTDQQGRKQGKWIIFSSQQTRIIEQGFYKDNRKHGVWKKYYSNGNLQSEITYKKGAPRGTTKIYYRNGNLSEKGYWVGDHWKGEYRFYHKNGNPAYIWHYNDKGQRTGTQKYFYADGTLKVKGKWKDGEKNGVIKKYYDNGDMKAQIVYNEGSVEEGTRKEYRKSAPHREKSADNDKTSTKKQKDEDENVGVFKGTGQNQIYNENKQLIEEGMYREGKLYNGKKYRYNNEGKKVQTIIIENGRVKDIINH